MLPWGHLAVGYLAFACWLDLRGRSDATPGALLALAVGTQLPDLLDKPLAWYLHVLPTGRSLAHSLFVAVAVVAVTVAVARRLERPLVGVGFAIGYLTHLAGDALYPLLDGTWSDLGYLLWPVTTPAVTETDYTVLEVLLTGTFSATGAFETALFGLAIAVWVHRGAPGIDGVRDRLASR